MARMERIKRGIIHKDRLVRSKETSGFADATTPLSTIILVPLWVKRDAQLYTEIKRRRFTSQAALDGYLGTAFSTSRIVKFADTDGHASAPVKSDHRKTPTSRFLNTHK
jgi:hypothetical protein